MRNILSTAVFSILLGAAVSPVASQECVALRNAGRPAHGESLLVAPAADTPAELLEAAVRSWHACGEHAVGFPEIRTRGSATRTVWVSYRPDRMGEGHCGSFAGRRIELYDRMRTADGAIVPCGPLDQNLAHEIGHALGLRDAMHPACGHFVMAPIRRQGPERRPRSGECAAVDRRWLTASETAELERHPGELGSGRAR